MDNLDDLTREELYEVAAGFDIPGRSRLSKKELRQAIEAAEKKRNTPPKPKPSTKKYSYEELFNLRVEMHEAQVEADRAMNTHLSQIKIRNQGGIPRIPIDEAAAARKEATKKAVAATRRFESAQRSSK